MINLKAKLATKITEVLFITSYPPRECGIATYSEDLIKSLNNKFNKSLQISVCALESGICDYEYSSEVVRTLHTENYNDYFVLADSINKNKSLKIVLIQHEFGFFAKQEDAFLQLITSINKPVVIVFHTVLPKPDFTLKHKVRAIAKICKSIIVMTNRSKEILIQDYEISPHKITVIAHGTHLVLHENKHILKEKYNLQNRKVLTTFGLLSSGKSIETTIEALPEIVKYCKEVMFLIIGKTHPEVLKYEGEVYRNMLHEKVESLNLQEHVRFVNSYLDLPQLLDYLQLTDVYVFTTNDPNQAVSGTFAYAMSCACPIISTPIPHAQEVLTNDTGIIFDFCDSKQLSKGVLSLLSNDILRETISTNVLQKIVSTAWENSAVAHAILFEEIINENIELQYNIPPINMSHIYQMTSSFGFVQFAKVNQPDFESGYTVDDNARALIATCMCFNEFGDEENLILISTYVNFLKFCLQKNGRFLNYVDKNKQFTSQNYETNIDDSNGRAIWALGYVISLKNKLPKNIFDTAFEIYSKAINEVETMYSTRSMAFIIKGIYFCNITTELEQNFTILNIFSQRIANMYRHESSVDWEWYEAYVTYANSILPEAMLYAYKITKKQEYKNIAIASLDFLLLHTFNAQGIEVISNKSWLVKGSVASKFGEQPIDVAYTIITLSEFYDEFNNQEYYNKIIIAFNWFLGQNRLMQIIYNPCTGGCYDGLEEFNVNLNQGAESTLSYTIARLVIEKYK